MKEIKKIFVILDSGTTHQPALRRALRIQKDLDTQLVLYLPERESAAVDSPYLAPPITLPLQESFWEERRNWLQGLTSDLASKDIDAECIFDVADDWQHKVQATIIESECDLVMMAAHHHPWLDRLVHLHRDWHVLRNCTKPLWICKSEELADGPRFLVCVALGYGKAVAAMDEDLMLTGGRLAEQLNGAMHLAHCLEPISAVTDSLGTAVGARPMEIETADLEDKHADALNHAALRHQVLPSRVHFATGHVSNVIPRLAKELGTDCVVLGTAARHGMERLMLGSTVESVLDLLPMDVLVVPPKG